jgi:hypothetical protein
MFVGTSRFLFCEGAKTLAEVAARGGFKDFGNVKVFQLQPQVSGVERITAKDGVRNVEGSTPTLMRLMYKLTSEESDNRNLLFAYMGRQTTPFTQAALAAANADALAFDDNAAVPENWYDLTKDGQRIRELDEVVIAGLEEDVDYFVDYKGGMIRFTEVQNAELTPVVTAPAITEDDAQYLKAILPMVVAQRSGLGRWSSFDQDPDSNLVLEHDAFTCEIKVDGQPQVDGEKIAEQSLLITVTGNRGTVYNRD